MISHRHIRRTFILLLSLAASASDAAAQIEFASIPWGASKENVSERIRAAGYTYRGVDQDGDVVFGAADSVDLVAMVGSGGLAQVELTWLHDPDRLPARFDRMADSLRAALGAPDSAAIEEWERYMTWARDGATLELFYRPRSGGMDSVLSLRHAGPESMAVFEERATSGEEERDTTGVGNYHQAFGGFRVLIRVDTVKYERLGPQLYGAYFLHDWMQMRRLPNGKMYSAAYSRMELDCSEHRTRTVRRIYLFDGPAETFFYPARERQWSRPEPESPDGVALRSACEALGRQP